MSVVELCTATTLRGDACKNRALPGSERCAVHVRPDTLGGRPTKLTPELADRFVAMLKAGNYVTVAAHAAGLHRSTITVWLRRGQSQRVVDAPYREFRERVEQARAEGEVRNVAQIASAARESWQAAAWLLERQFPERWGRPSSPQRREQPPDEPAVAAAVAADPFEEVDELAERRRKQRQS